MNSVSAFCAMTTSSVEVEKKVVETANGNLLSVIGFSYCLASQLITIDYGVYQSTSGEEQDNEDVGSPIATKRLQFKGAEQIDEALNYYRDGYIGCATMLNRLILRAESVEGSDLAIKTIKV